MLHTDIAQEDIALVEEDYQPGARLARYLPLSARMIPRRMQTQRDRRPRR